MEFDDDEMLAGCRARQFLFGTEGGADLVLGFERTDPESSVWAAHKLAGNGDHDGVIGKHGGDVRAGDHQGFDIGRARCVVELDDAMNGLEIARRPHFRSSCLRGTGDGSGFQVYFLPKSESGDYKAPRQYRRRGQYLLHDFLIDKKSPPFTKVFCEGFSPQ